MYVLLPAKAIETRMLESFMNLFKISSADPVVVNKYLTASKQTIPRSEDQGGTLSAAVLRQLQLLQEPDPDSYLTSGTQLDATLINQCESQWWSKFPALKERSDSSASLWSLYAYASIFKSVINFLVVDSTACGQGIKIFPLDDDLAEVHTYDRTLRVFYNSGLYWSLVNPLPPFQVKRRAPPKPRIPKP